VQLAEKCPLKLRIARLGPAPGNDAPTLFAFGYAPATESVDEMDARVHSFLRDLGTLIPSRRSPDDPAPVQTSRADEMSLLVAVSGQYTRGPQLWRTHRHVVDECRRALDAHCAFVWLRDGARLEISFREPPSEELQSDVRKRWKMFARRLADSHHRGGDPLSVERLPREHPVSQGFAAPLECVSVPVVAHGRTQGVLCGLRHTAGAQLSDTEARLVRSLGAQLGLAITNAALSENLKGFLTNTVKTLVSAIDAKDTYTSGHSERVNIVSMLLGNEMGLELEDLEALYWGALLHDVGKIGMPEAVLNKPGALEENELDIVREHPERGWEMLHAIEQLRRAADGVRYHHEHWDGTGYPEERAGEAIPIIARIIAVADTFDATISNRSDRRGRSASEAVALIEESSGTQFDPAVVETLRCLLPMLEKHRWVLLSGQKVRSR
jgi:putative nucleotidyltransferase with HDIG domain